MNNITFKNCMMGVCAIAIYCLLIAAAVTFFFIGQYLFLDGCQDGAANPLESFDTTWAAIWHLMWVLVKGAIMIGSLFLSFLIILAVFGAFQG